MSEVSTDPIRVALRSMTHGVYVLSVHYDGRDEYLIVSLAMQCSVEPPRIAVAISKESRMFDPLRHAEGGVLSVLDANQTAAVRRYGTPGGTRNAPMQAQRSSHGHPCPEEASYWLDLRVVQQLDTGDHVLFVLEALAATAMDHTFNHAFTPMTLRELRMPYGG